MSPMQRFHFSAKAIAGCILIAIGVLFMLENLGIIEGYALWEFWPVILIVVGAGHALRPRQPGQRIWGILEIAFGAFFLLRTLGVFWISFWKIWPIMLVLTGAYLIWQAMMKRGAPGGPDETLSAGRSLQEFALFGGGDRVFRSDDFRGGSVSAIFGGFDIDLRQAVITGDSAAIDVFVLFGGVDLKVPEAWNVIMNVTSILGSAEYKPLPGIAVEGPRKTLTVTGVVIFGGVDVKT